MRVDASPSRTATVLPPGSRALWRRWVLLVSIGELVGFSAPGVVGAWTAGMSSGAQLPALVAAGMVEGAVLGGAQARVLAPVLRGFRSGAWVVATSAAAGFAWLLGMLPSTTYSSWSTWPVGVAVVVGAVVGLVLLLSIGTAQALVLPAGTPGPGGWIGWTAAGWCTGLVAFGIVAPPLWHEGQEPVVSVLIGLAGAAAMALTMAAVTGVGAVRLCARAAEGRGTRSRNGMSLDSARKLRRARAWGRPPRKDHR